VAYHGHGTHKDGPGGKSQTSLLRSTRYLGTNCLLCIAIQYFSVRADDAKKMILTYPGPSQRVSIGQRALRR
jgi:hypothetical protein